MTAELTFTELLLVLAGIAVGVGLLVALLVYAGGARSTKRYRPGRPFEFTPVWFLAAPERQARAGRVGPAPGGEPRPAGKELLAAPARRATRPPQTGGASDRW